MTPGRRIELQGTVTYVGPRPLDRHYGDPGYTDRPVGSTGKVRGLERGAVWVDWGGGDEGWEPRSYVLPGFVVMDS